MADRPVGISRRRLLVGGLATAATVATVAAATGCGSDDDSNNNSADNGNSDGEAAPTTAVDAGRVVALGEETVLADLLALGIRPVASTSNVADAGFPGVEADTSGIEALPSYEPNLERLAALRPDVLVVPSWVFDYVDEADLRPLGELVIVTSDDARESLRELAAGFDAGDRADELIADLDAAVAEGREALGAEGRTVSVVTVYPGPTIAAWVDGPTAVPATLLELGFTLRPGPEDVGDAPIGRFYMSLERLDLLDGDDLVTLQSELVEGEPEALAEITADPIWSGLDAVAAGRVVTIDRLGYPGITGRHRLVDDIVRELSRP